MDDARWREACCDSDRVSAADTRDGRVKAFKRAKAELVHRQMVGSINGYVFLRAATEFSIEPDIIDAADIGRLVHVDHGAAH